jgi:hypothetical protein
MLQTILDWSEVWATLIPLFFLLRKKTLPSFMVPVKIYVWLALILNLSIDIIMDFYIAWNFPSWLRNNNHLYNIHSITRLILFTWFFIRLNQPQLVNIKKIIPILFVAFAIINFMWFEPFNLFSSRLHTTESAILLFYCLQYYFYFLQQDQMSFKKNPSFWATTGLSLYVVINFFIFLFYKTLIEESIQFAVSIWDVHNISYIIFCIFLGKAFYESK